MRILPRQCFAPEAFCPLPRGRCAEMLFVALVASSISIRHRGNDPRRRVQFVIDCPAEVLSAPSPAPFVRLVLQLAASVPAVPCRIPANALREKRFWHL